MRTRDVSTRTCLGRSQRRSNVATTSSRGGVATVVARLLAKYGNANCRNGPRDRRVPQGATTASISQGPLGDVAMK
jgi:hypothetical protein